MTTTPTEPTAEQKEAASRTIGVHLLTEFFFCARAGICTAEQHGTVNEPHELPTPAWMAWEEQELIRRLQQATREFCSLAAVTVAGTIALAGVAHFWLPYFWLVVLIHSG